MVLALGDGVFYMKNGSMCWEWLELVEAENQKTYLRPLFYLGMDRAVCAPSPL